ncbi:hypothetical protein U8527_21520 [Kordia algicida OT-1]|uniref:Lipocalin-like domain-containing protein n=1 Tax=Kordia algicida OT-1 TaxID=391587 RepID=A9DLM0_9FLAO|nr:hypothetical protein [Kordia algicida]EDP98594.1 hypothetical protein KAOT1_15292 [Kordia algicida OT-1]
MKKLFLVLITVGLLYSCNNDDDDVAVNDILGTWKLVEMSGSILNWQTTGADMDWQETYTLNTNGTFMKTRVQNGTTTQASGTFTFIEGTADGNVIDFTFDSDNDIIANCSAELVERMYLESDDTFFSGWIACDGPGLKYEKN